MTRADRSTTWSRTSKHDLMAWRMRWCTKGMECRRQAGKLFGAGLWSTFIMQFTRQTPFLAPQLTPTTRPTNPNQTVDEHLRPTLQVYDRWTWTEFWNSKLVLNFFELLVLIRTLNFLCQFRHLIFQLTEPTQASKPGENKQEKRHQSSQRSGTLFRWIWPICWVRGKYKNGRF